MREDCFVYHPNYSGRKFKLSENVVSFHREFIKQGECAYADRKAEGSDRRTHDGRDGWRMRDYGDGKRRKIKRLTTKEEKIDG